jgi:hypothetical protein
VIACDNDKAGQKLAETIKSYNAVPRVETSKLKDFNEDLQNQKQEHNQTRKEIAQKAKAVQPGSPTTKEQALRASEQARANEIAQKVKEKNRGKER